MGSDVLSRTTSGGIVPITQGLDSLSKVAEQVPSIGDLDSSRCALTNAVSVSAGTIASDNLRARAIPQPVSDGRGLAIGQEIDHLVCLKVQEHRSVAAAASPTLRWLSNGCAVGTLASSAQSSMPRTRGLRIICPGRGAAARRNSVSGLVGVEMRLARRAPASPPSARPRWR